MAFAVIKTGGKQYLVEEGRFIMIEKITGVKEGDKITFDQVLLTDSGTDTAIGTPNTGGKVMATAQKIGRDEKKIVVKYKAKSRYHKKRGHRQPNLQVMIDKI